MPAPRGMRGALLSWNPDEGLPACRFRHPDRPWRARAQLGADRRVLLSVEFGLRGRQDCGAGLPAADSADDPLPDCRGADAGDRRRGPAGKTAQRPRCGVADPAGRLEQRAVPGAELDRHDHRVVRVHRRADQHQSLADRRAGRPGAG
ncbi:hypothetical protein G6F57_021795 [Rhizopus arrhizus]|nr:hypothetical protein G6F57_021795 [Rhizopus arrhizus]